MIDLTELTMGEAEALRLGQGGRPEFSRCGSCKYAGPPNLAGCETPEAVRATQRLQRQCNALLPPWLATNSFNKNVSVNSVCDLWKQGIPA